MSNFIDDHVLPNWRKKANNIAVNELYDTYFCWTTNEITVHKGEVHSRNNMIFAKNDRIENSF